MSHKSGNMSINNNGEKLQSSLLISNCTSHRNLRPPVQLPNWHAKGLAFFMGTNGLFFFSMPSLFQKKETLIHTSIFEPLMQRRMSVYWMLSIADLKIDVMFFENFAQSFYISKNTGAGIIENFCVRTDSSFRENNKLITKI